MADVSESSKKSGELYSISKQKERVEDEYRYWSDITKTIHAPYKLFSLSKYLKISLSWELGKGFQRSPISVDKDDENDMILSWMEHRRWNAYLRSCGFTGPTAPQLARIAAGTENHAHKNISLKLHSCLVEADIKKFPLHLVTFPVEDPSQYDNLDLVSIYDYVIKRVLSDKKYLVSIYDYVIKRVLSDKKYDSADLEIFFDKKRLLFETNERLEKYGISLDKLRDEEYRKNDGISMDSKLQNLVAYNGETHSD